MTELLMNPNARLTDALERDLLRTAMDSQANTHMLKHTGAAIARAVRTFSSYVVDTLDAMNRARAASAYYTGSQW